MNNNELIHFGIKGMKWGKRKIPSFPAGQNIRGMKWGKRNPSRLYAKPGVSSQTKKVINDYNNMDDKKFSGKYQVSKSRYAKRVKKYGDPYMNSPLAKAGKKLQAMANENTARYNKQLKIKTKGEQVASAFIQKNGKSKLKLSPDQQSKIRSGEVSYYKTDGTPVKIIGF